MAAKKISSINKIWLRQKDIFNITESQGFFCPHSFNFDKNSRNKIGDSRDMTVTAFRNEKLVYLPGRLKMDGLVTETKDLESTKVRTD